MTQLHHPFVVTFYGICDKTVNNEQTGGYDEERKYMVIELASGGSLEGIIEEAELIKKLLKTQPNSNKKIPITQMDMVKWTVQIAAGMTYIHSRGFIHRDIKPSNILLSKSNDALICDLGTVKNMSPDAPQFDQHLIDEITLLEIANRKKYTPNAVDPEVPLMTKRLGTPLYMSPEQHLDTNNYTNAVDVWAFGVLMVRLFSLSWPYPPNVTTTQLKIHIARNELRPNKVKRRDLPHPAIQDVIEGCLEYRAVERLTFAQIEIRLAKILKEMEDMDLKLKELSQFLDSLDLLEHFDTFVTDGAKCKEDLVYVTVEDLMKLGIHKITARKLVTVFSKICLPGGGETKNEEMKSNDYTASDGTVFTLPRNKNK